MTLFVLLLGATRGHAPCARAADSERIQSLLRVQSGATCLTQETLVPHVEQWLHDVHISGTFLIEVEGSATDPRSARLRVVRDQRTVAHRAFEPGPARCRHFLAVVGLAIALTIKASLLDELGRPLPDDPAIRAQAWSASGAALLTYRLLPEIAPGVGLSVRRALGEHLSLGAGVLGVTAFHAPLAQRAGTFNATLVAARAEVCARSQLAPIAHAGFCLGGLGGALYAAGSDVPAVRRSVVGLAALSNSLDLELDLTTRWTLALGLSMTFLLHSVRIGVVDERGSPVGSRALTSPGFTLGVGASYHL